MNRLLTSTAVACGLALAFAAPVSAQSGGEVLQADLAAQNGSGARATATVTLNDDDTMTVSIDGTGFKPGEAPTPSTSTASSARTAPARPWPRMPTATAS